MPARNLRRTGVSRSQLFALVSGASVLTHLLSLAQLGLAAQSGQTVAQSGPSESTSSSQPLWSYQIKPSNYMGSQLGSGSGAGHYGSGATGSGPFSNSLLDAFSGLSQRQGTLTSSPFMTILPIILIAAGGMLLLLPLFTMMMASPFGGGFGAGFQGPFGGGYPQVVAKKRSLGGGNEHRGLFELIENFSSTIEDLSRKYSPAAAPSAAASAPAQAQFAAHKRVAKAGDDMASTTGQSTPANHKSSSSDDSNAVNNLFGIGDSVNIAQTS